MAGRLAWPGWPDCKFSRQVAPRRARLRRGGTHKHQARAIKKSEPTEPAQHTWNCFRKAGASDGSALLLRYLAWACTQQQKRAGGILRRGWRALHEWRQSWWQLANLWSETHQPASQHEAGQAESSSGSPSQEVRSPYLGVLDQQLVLAGALQLQAVVVQQALQHR